MKCDECHTESADGLERDWIVGNLASQWTGDHRTAPGPLGWEHSYAIHSRYKDIESMNVFVCSACQEAFRTRAVSAGKRWLLASCLVGLGFGGAFLQIPRPTGSKVVAAVAVICAVAGALGTIATVVWLRNLWQYAFRPNAAAVADEIALDAATRKKSLLKRQFLWSPAEFEREFGPLEVRNGPAKGSRP